MKLKSSTDIIEALARRLGGVSDYRVSKELGIPPQVISSVRAGRRGLSRSQCKSAASILGVEAGALITIVAAEREDDAELRASMLKVAARGMAAAMLLGIGLASAPQPAQATDGGRALFIMSTRRRAGMKRKAPPVSLMFNNRLQSVTPAGAAPTHCAPGVTATAHVP